MNWYIGQEVVCVEGHFLGLIKEGQSYVISGLQKSPCKCGGVEIAVGVPFAGDGQQKECTKCNSKYKNDGIHWFYERRFKPLDTLCDISELTEILETTKPFEA